MAKKKQTQKTSTQIPDIFFNRLTDIVGHSLYSTVRRTFVERPTTCRVNTIKEKNAARLQSDLRDLGFKLQTIPWYRDAFILLNKTKRDLTETEAYKEGRLYIQSLASMVPPLVLDPRPGETVLDLTAAPGSKTSQIAALMDTQGTLIANDNNKPRFFKLKHNVELLGVTEARAGWSCTLRMENGWDLAAEYPEYFDKILLDAPCSAEARFIDGEPRTYGYWSERKIKEMAYTQRKLILSAWPALKPGGTLVYSTCTFAAEENEIQIARLLERYAGQASLVPWELNGLKTIRPVSSWKGRDILPRVGEAARIFPTSEVEGFFIAKLKKAQQS